MLRQRDAVRNSYRSLQDSRKMGEQTRALAQEGRKHTVRPRAHRDAGTDRRERLDQRRPLLSPGPGQLQDPARVSRPMPASLLDERDLQALSIRHPDISVEDAIKVALAGGSITRMRATRSRTPSARSNSPPTVSRPSSTSSPGPPSTATRTRPPVSPCPNSIVTAGTRAWTWTCP